LLPYRRHIPILTVIALAAAAYFWDLSFNSLWLDEVETLGETASLSSVFEDRGNAMLYCTLIWVWRNLFGDSAFALRSFSALCTLASIFFVYAITLQLGKNRTVAIVAAVIFAFLPFTLNYAREARTYALWTLCTLGCFRALLDFNGEFKQSSRFLIWSCLGLLAHNYMVFFSLGFAVFLLLQRKHLKAVLWVHFLYASFGYLLLIRLITKTEIPSIYFDTFLWSGATTESLPSMIANTLFRKWQMPFAALQGWQIGMVILASSIAGLLYIGVSGQRRTAMALACSAWLPAILIYVLPIRRYSRLYSPAMPLICLLLVLPMAFVRTRSHFLAFGVAATLFLGFSLQQAKPIYTVDFEPWKEVCRQLQSQSSILPLIWITAEYTANSFKYCYRGRGFVRTFSDTPEHIDQNVHGSRNFKTIWIIYAHSPRVTESRLVASMAQMQGREQKEYDFGSFIKAYRFGPPRAKNPL
jgi:uncharacterized membrane protein